MVARGKNSAGNTDNFFGLKGIFSKFSVMGAYDVTKANGSTAKSATLSGTYALDGGFVLGAGVGQVDVDGVKAQKMASVGTLYSLSKRTSVYADLAHKAYPTRSVNVYGVGMAHSF